jgi:hypothetical protein
MGGHQPHPIVIVLCRKPESFTGSHIWPDRFAPSVPDHYLVRIDAGAPSLLVPRIGSDFPEAPG